MLNFTVGPVMTDGEILKIAGQSSPYFRTPEFSEIMRENEREMLSFLHAPDGSRCVFLTASGTGAMESCVMNLLSSRDKVLCINGGSFGQRFVDLCRLHRRDMTELRVEFGRQIRPEQLAPYAGCGYTALLVNMDETSSGTLYDMGLLSDFCRKNGILLIVDAISAFITDELDMEALGADAVITGSQKALAVHPGVSVIALAPEALRRVEENEEVCMYLSLKEALKNGERGQTPFTPAVTTLLEIHARLGQIRENGGLEAERNRIASLAANFRRDIAAYPLELVSESPSNCVTALRAPRGNAKEIVRVMKDEYRIWLCPNGGEWADTVFRVGHIGSIRPEDMDELMRAFAGIRRRGLL